MTLPLQFILSLSKDTLVRSSSCPSDNNLFLAAKRGHSALLQIAFSLFTFLIINLQKTSAATLPTEKVITVNVNGSGIITVGRDTISSDDLAMYIRQRLFKSYTGTGKMYDAVKLSINGEPKTAVLEVIKKEIASGLKKTLNELCLEKYKKLYEDLSTRQQSKLKKNFKVLFESSYE